MIDWMKYRWLYFSISGVVILLGIFSMLKWGLNLGVDFTGGAKLEYKLPKPVEQKDLEKQLKDKGIELSSIQKTGSDIYIFKFAPIDQNKKEIINKAVSALVGQDIKELSFENLGPSIGSELVRKTIYALLISTSAILLWIAYQFKSLKFGLSATLATLHDSLVLLGSFSILGHIFGAEVDFLFVTAMLTVLSFSVHDTIVVFDRLREKMKKYGSSRNVADMINDGISETMVRSLNNSFTIIFMLVALVLFGGQSILWFAVALLIGTISGTYSSPFVALPLLYTWEIVEANFKKRKLK